MSVVVVLFLSIGLAVIAIGVAVGLHLVEPIGGHCHVNAVASARPVL